VVLSRQQKAFWTRNGYLVYDEPLLSSAEVERLAQRIKDIASAELSQVPAEMFRFEKVGGVGGSEGGDRYDTVRNIAFVHRYDDLVRHYTGPNRTSHRRRGVAIHYIRAQTRYIGNPGDRQPPFLLMRGQEIPGRAPGDSSRPES
jgi:hypothetical protein